MRDKQRRGGVIINIIKNYKQLLNMDGKIVYVSTSLGKDHDFENMRKHKVVKTQKSIELEDVRTIEYWSMSNQNEFESLKHDFGMLIERST